MCSLKLMKGLKKTLFRSKHVAQLDILSLLYNKDSCVETDTDFFIHIIYTQRDVTGEKSVISFSFQYL